MVCGYTAHSDVVILGSNGFVDSNLQAAVDAASDGDTLLISGSNYGSFDIDGKGLTLLAAPNTTPVIDGQVRIINIPQNASARVDSLRVIGQFHADDVYPLKNETAVILDQSAGVVRFYGCELLKDSAVRSIRFDDPG